MRRILFPLVLLFFVGHLSAQDVSDIGKISLSVVMPESIEGLSAAQVSQLETKIVHIASVSGIVASTYDEHFIIIPRLELGQSSVVEGGMQNIYTSSAELSLFIKQADNNSLFASVSTELKGSGSSKQQAISNIISNIRPDNPEYKAFIEKAKARIIAYYEANCNSILESADNMAKKQEYAASLSLLMSIPLEVNKCYNTAQKKSIEIFAAYQNQICTKLVQGAKVEIAAQNYGIALSKLSSVDPSSKCNSEVTKLIASIEDKVTEQQKKDLDLILKLHNDDVALEKERINAIKEIAVAYVKSTSTSSKKHKEKKEE